MSAIAAAVGKSTATKPENPVSADDLASQHVSHCQKRNRDSLASAIRSGELLELLIEARQASMTFDTDNADLIQQAKNDMRAHIIDIQADKIGDNGTARLSDDVKAYWLSFYFPAITNDRKAGKPVTADMARKLYGLVKLDRATMTYDVADDHAVKGNELVRDILAGTYSKPADIAAETNKILGKPVKAKKAKPEAQQPIAAAPVGDSLEQWVAIGRSADRAHVAALVAGFQAAHDVADFDALLNDLASLAEKAKTAAETIEASAVVA